MPPSPSFEALLAEAEALDPEREWGAGFLEGRTIIGSLPWDWLGIVKAVLVGAPSLLDQGTGNGRLLTRFGPLPALTVATEGWVPAVRAAHQLLRPRGVHLVMAADAPDNIEQTPAARGTAQPFRHGRFDVVHNRHTAYSPEEVRRLLKSRGAFVTQQAGGWNGVELNRVLGGPNVQPNAWSLEFAAEQLESAGLRVVKSGEARPTTTFTDVAAVACYIKSVPWEVPGFSLEGYRPALADLHERIMREGPLVLNDHYFWLLARHQ